MREKVGDRNTGNTECDRDVRESVIHSGRECDSEKESEIEGRV